MYYRHGRLIFSPTDLTVFFESEFASWIDRFHADGNAGRITDSQGVGRDQEDEEARQIAVYGQQHGRFVPDGLKRKGLDLVELASNRAYEACEPVLQDC